MLHTSNIPPTPRIPRHSYITNMLRVVPARLFRSANLLKTRPSPTRSIFLGLIEARRTSAKAQECVEALSQLLGLLNKPLLAIEWSLPDVDAALATSTLSAAAPAFEPVSATILSSTAQAPMTKTILSATAKPFVPQATLSNLSAQADVFVPALPLSRIAV